MTVRRIATLLVVLCSCLQISTSSIVFEEETIVSPSISKSNFSYLEVECFTKGKVLYEPDGKCYKLLEVGPCVGERQWLVLDKEEVITGSGKLRSVCRHCPCCGKPYRAVFWPEDEQCHRLIRESKELCPALGTVLQIDPFGEGECDCINDPPHAKWHVRDVDNENGPCYQLYKKGPCHNGFIFVADGNTTRCKKDPCAHQNQGKDDIDFVKWESGNGRCYELGSKGPCQGESTSFDIHPVTRKPDCISRVNQIVDLPTICDTDQNGNCRKEVTLPSNTEYLNDLILSAQKKRFKRRTRTNKHQDVGQDG